jgi:CrcB protein
MPLTSYRRPFVGTGVCGALTTFSTMQVELLEMLDGDHAGLALAYAAASVASGFLAVAAATNLVRRARLGW